MTDQPLTPTDRHVPEDVQAELDQPRPLAPVQIERFRQDGFIKAPGFFSEATLRHFDPIVTSLTLERDPNRGKALEDLGTYGRAFVQVGNLWTVDERVRRLALCRRGAQAAADLLGCKHVRMWHDQALFKKAGGGFTPWHADQQYWPFDTGQCVTLWMPFHAVPLDMGPLAFARGSHLKNIGRDLAISDDSERQIQQAVRQAGLDEVYEPYAAGEVSFHYGWTLHRAGPNQTSEARRVFTVIYMDAQMRLSPRTPAHREDWAKWTPSTHVGRVMDDPLNPLINA
jgi:hypothetical protein